MNAAFGATNGGWMLMYINAFCFEWRLDVIK